MKPKIKIVKLDDYWVILVPVSLTERESRYFFRDWHSALRFALQAVARSLRRPRDSSSGNSTETA